MKTENETDARIVAAARELFAKLGPSRARMTDVASRAGVSRKTLYQYYPGKEELLQSMIEGTFAAYDRQIDLILDNEGILFEEKLARLMAVMGEQLSWFSRPLVEDLRTSYPDIWRRTEDFRDRKVMRNLERLIEEGIARGIYRRDIDADLLALMIFHMSQNIIDPEVLAGLNLEAFEAFRSIIQVFMEGILTGKARGRFQRVFQQSAERQ